MKIRVFVLLSVIYIAFVAFCVFYLNPNNFSFELYGREVSFPVVFWVLGILAVYFVFSLVYFSLYAFLRYLKFKNFFKDASKFENFIAELLLEKESKTNFLTKEFRQASQLSKILKTKEKCSSSKLNEILDVLDGLEKKQSFNLNKFKLDDNNALLIQNQKNTLEDVLSAYSRLKNKQELKDELDQIAFNTLLEKANYEYIKELKISKSKEQILLLFQRLGQGSLDFSLSDAEELLKHEFSKSQYLDLACLCYKKFDQELITLFAKLKDINSQACEAYLYLLAEFGLLDELREYIHKDEKSFIAFKAFLILKENNINFDIKKLL